MSARLLSVVPVLFALATAARATTYPVRNLEPDDALMALNVRVPDLGQDCHVTVQHSRNPQTSGIKGTLDVVCGTPAMQAKIQPALDAADTPAPTHQFHIAVLAASRKDGPVPDVSPSEAKALADFKKVMTYKSFNIEAETIIQSDREATAQLSGLYLLDMALGQKNGESIDINSFRLRAATPQASPGGDKQSYFPTYIQTSFSLKKGETIVLGASVSDQQARVVLVTALP